MLTKVRSFKEKAILCGAVAGPLFILIVLIQDFTRPGFNPSIHLLSQLSLGQLGWIQVINFVSVGVLNIFYSIGLWKTLRSSKTGKLASIFIAIFGLFLILVGIFKTDPSHGFPPGLITPVRPSGHAIIHALGGLFTFLSLIASILIFALFFFKQKKKIWAIYLLISAVLIVTFFIMGMTNPTFMGPALQIATLIGWTAPSLIALNLLKNQ